MNWRFQALYRWAILVLRALWSALLALTLTFAYLLIDPEGGEQRVCAAGYALTLLGIEGRDDVSVLIFHVPEKGWVSMSLPLHAC